MKKFHVCSIDFFTKGVDLKNAFVALGVLALACIPESVMSKDDVPSDPSGPILIRDCFVYTNATTACEHCKKFPLPLGELCGSEHCNPDVHVDNVYKGKVIALNGGLKHDGNHFTRCHIMFFKCVNGVCVLDESRDFDWNGGYPGLQIPCDDQTSEEE